MDSLSILSPVPTPSTDDSPSTAPEAARPKRSKKRSKKPRVPPVVFAGEPDLTSYDLIVVNSSAGKDSSAMLALLVERCRALGILERVVVAHADLGRVEWQGTVELAEQQAVFYGLPFFKMKRPQGDLLEHIERHGKWPDAKNRYCTSDHKRSQIQKIITAQVATLRAKSGKARVRVLNCMGMRKDESPKRAKMNAYESNPPASNGRREVDQWLPIHGWTEAQVWERVRASGLPVHPAYGLGMPRLSCVLCVLASRDALLTGGLHNPELLAEYVRVEQKIGHTFRHKLPILSIQQALAAGERPTGRVEGWCA